MWAMEVPKKPAIAPAATAVLLSALLFMGAAGARATTPDPPARNVAAAPVKSASWRTGTDFCPTDTVDERTLTYRAYLYVDKPALAVRAIFRTFTSNTVIHSAKIGLKREDSDLPLAGSFRPVTFNGYSSATLAPGKTVSDEMPMSVSPGQWLILDTYGTNLSLGPQDEKPSFYEPENAAGAEKFSNVVPWADGGWHVPAGGAELLCPGYKPSRKILVIADSRGGLYNAPEGWIRLANKKYDITSGFRSSDGMTMEIEGFLPNRIKYDRYDAVMLMDLWCNERIVPDSYLFKLDRFKAAVEATGAAFITATLIPCAETDANMDQRRMDINAVLRHSWNAADFDRAVRDPKRPFIMYSSARRCYILGDGSRLHPSKKGSAALAAKFLTYMRRVEAQGIMRPRDGFR